MYVWDELDKYRGWLAKHPYCGGRKLLAAWLVDNCFIFMDTYVYLTLNNEGWLTRASA